MKVLSIECGLIVVSLMASVSGCASPRVSTLPNSSGTVEGSSKEVHVLGLGDEARIKLHNGESISGEVLAVSEKSVTLGRSGNYGYEKDVVERSKIAGIEYIGDDRTWPIVAGLGVVLVASFVWFLNNFPGGN